MAKGKKEEKIQEVKSPIDEIIEEAEKDISGFYYMPNGELEMIGTVDDLFNIIDRYAGSEVGRIAKQFFDQIKEDCVGELDAYSNDLEIAENEVLKLQKEISSLKK